MQTKGYVYPDKASYDYVVTGLKDHNVTFQKMINIIYDLSVEFVPSLTKAECLAALNKVLSRRDVLSNAMVMLNLDKLANQNQLDEPLNSIIGNDAGIFTVDEELAINIAHIYGDIGVTNFGYLDRKKKGIIKELDTNNKVSTFIDDLVSAIIAASCSYISHHNSGTKELYYGK